MRCAVNGKQYDEALNLFKQMAEFNVPASAVTYNLLMGVYSTVNDPISVLRVYFSMLNAKIAP